MSASVLVVGGGIAGIQASLDLAESGARVVLVERAPTIGGKMAVLDKNFPTLDCSICIEAPKMSEVGQHPNIEILSLAEVESVTGEAGRFQVGIRQQARFVTDECTRCGECEPACPVLLPNEFDAAMASRKAIYTPIAQAVPGPYVVDIRNCLNEPPNYLPCARCVQACGPRCIDFGMPLTRRLEREVGAIVVAVGYDLIDPLLLREYGYGSHPDILTSIELERLLTSAGPTGGEIIRPSDGHHPERVLLVLCVGSRDRRFYRYCSRFCCMYSVKHAFQLLDHGVKDVTVLYMDLRAYGKGFDRFLERTRVEGAKFVRGRPAAIRSDNGALRVRYEDTRAGRVREEAFDMVVLATAARPPERLAELARVLGIELDEDGFIRAVERQAALIATTRAGIYAAGCASGPKDIPDSVAEAGAAASLAVARLLESGEPVPGVGTVLWVGQPYRPGSVAAFGVAPDGSLVWMLEEWRESGTDRFQVIRWWFSVHPARVRDDRILPIDTEREGALHRGNIVETMRGRKRVPLTAEAVSKFTQAWGFLTGSPCDPGIAGR